MSAALLARFRPNGPWRFGGPDGAAESVDPIGHSDTLFSAVCYGMSLLGKLDEWLDATVRSERSAVRFTSLFPLAGDILFVAPPRSLWPPPPSGRVRWKSARFVPVHAVQDLIRGNELNDENWSVDTASECLIPADRKGTRPPFRVSLRSHAGVDRLNSGAAIVHRKACIEFRSGGGMWCAVMFASDESRAAWKDSVQAALLLLSDSGLGAERSIGWGGSSECAFEEVELDELLLGSARTPETTGENVDTPERGRPAAWWLLSLFSPGDNEAIDWENGAYSVAFRGGVNTRRVRMITEGSVVFCETEPTGTSRDISAADGGHPVFRFGAPVAVPVAYR
jgi:CRISPR type III-A-associated RAMP protein Csm4